jgi:tetratricopeptide (TPR) repeat protein
MVFRRLGDRVAREAYRLNPTLPYSLLVQYQVWYHRERTEGTLDSAFKYMHRAFLASPNRGLICSEFGGFFTGAGLYDNALAMFKRAREIDPSRAYRYLGVSTAYYFLGHVQSAEENANKAQSLEPNNLIALQLLVQINSDRKNFKQAETLIEKIEQINPERDVSDLKALVLAESGDKEKALRIVKTRDIQFIHVALKMKNETLDDLEKSPTNYLSLKNAHYDFLGGDPRFEKIVGKAKSVYELRLKKYHIDLPDN